MRSRFPVGARWGQPESLRARACWNGQASLRADWWRDWWRLLPFSSRSDSLFMRQFPSALQRALRPNRPHPGALHFCSGELQRPPALLVSCGFALRRTLCWSIELFWPQLSWAQDPPQAWRRLVRAMSVVSKYKANPLSARRSAFLHETFKTWQDSTSVFD